MSKKNQPSIELGATKIETQGQRDGLRSVIAERVASPMFRANIAKAQAEALKGHRESLRDAHFAAYDEYVSLTKDGRMPSSPAELARYSALRDRFAGGGYTAYAVPGAADVHIDKALTNVLVDQPSGELIGDLILPLFPVDRRSDVIRTLDRSAYTTAAWDVTRAAGEPAKQGSWAYGSNVSFSVVNRALGFPVPDETQTNADAPLDPARDTMRIAEGIVRLKREIAIKDLVTTSTTYPAAHRLTTTTKWDNANSTNVEPRNDVQAAHDLIRKNLGKMANRIVLNFPMAQAICNLDDYRTRFQYVSQITDSVLMAKLADYFNVEQCLVGVAMYNSAQPGQTATFADVWPDDCVLFRYEEPSLAYAGLGFSPCTDPGTVMRWRDPNPSARADHAAFELDCDEVVVNTTAGVHIDDTLT